ncbi:amidohydrolase family-domain-containing protein [Phlyctochytrium arcticum]|nr:amidohydrolase family-domain-containing protein [Phlyctochytrium arcticum]
MTPPSRRQASFKTLPVPATSGVFFEDDSTSSEAENELDEPATTASRDALRKRREYKRQLSEKSLAAGKSKVLDVPGTRRKRKFKKFERPLWVILCLVGLTACYLSKDTLVPFLSKFKSAKSEQHGKVARSFPTSADSESAVTPNVVSESSISRSRTLSRASSTRPATARPITPELPTNYLIYNADVVTSDPSIPSTDAFIVKNGNFVAVGEEQELRKKYKFEREFNLGGKLVVPGLIDAHGHILEQGFALLQVDVTGAASASEVRRRIIAYLDANPFLEERARDSKEWIMGKGWDQTKWGVESRIANAIFDLNANGPTSKVGQKGGHDRDPDAFPTIQDLDFDSEDSEVAMRLSKIPICLIRIDFHAYWVNGEAMKKILQTQSKNNTLPEIKGGRVLTDPKTNRPSGVFVDNSMVYVSRAMEATGGERTETQYVDAIDAVVKELLQHGITSVHDAGLLPQEIRYLKRFVEDGRLPIRTYAMIKCSEAKEYCAQQIPVALDEKPGNGRLRVRSVKLFLDGALGSWGAAMYEPYSDKPEEEGLLRFTLEELEKIISKWIENGYQVNVHCIGDRANQIALDAFEGAYTKLSGGGANLRNRIEHVQLLRKEDIPRFAKLGIVPSMQPTHATSDMYYVEKRIGRKRTAEGAYVWQSLLKSGVERLPLGSDFPIESVDPLKGMYAAVTRLDQNGSSPFGLEGFFPGQRLSRQQALKGFTMDAAWAAFMENEIGSITPDKKADFVIFENNFMNESKPACVAYLNNRVIATVIEGRPMFGVLTDLPLSAAKPKITRKRLGHRVDEL